MGAKLGNHKGMDEINVTPLIDVVLVLLIIFMVLTPITMRTMANQLPPEDQNEPPPPPPDKPPDQLIVAVYKDGTLALNLKAMDDAELKRQVKLRLPGMEKKTVFIDAHPEANYARVVTVMDQVREAAGEPGAVKIALTELTETGPADPLPEGVAPIVGGAAPDAAAAPATP